jgi:hypothetical protein
LTLEGDACWEIECRAKVNPENVRELVAGALGSSWANRDALVREANNRWAPAAVINALMAVPGPLLP